jgi:hypothetical protein
MQCVHNRKKSADTLLNILNEVVTMLLDTFNVNKTQDEVLTLKNMAKNNNSNHKE